MKFSILGLTFLIYRWHSINLIPCVWLGGIYNDDQELAQLIQLTILGFIIYIDFRCRKQIYWNSGVWGPLYSRRRKVWYRASTGD